MKEFINGLSDLLEDEDKIQRVIKKSKNRRLWIYSDWPLFGSDEKLSKAVEDFNSGGNLDIFESEDSQVKFREVGSDLASVTKCISKSGCRVLEYDTFQDKIVAVYCMNENISDKKGRVYIAEEYRK